MGEKNFRQPTPLEEKWGKRTWKFHSQTIVPACPGDGTRDGGHNAAVVLCLMKGQDICGSGTI